MTTTAPETERARPAGPRLYGNWQQPKTPGLGRLGTVGTAAGLGGVIVAVLTGMLLGLVPATAVVGFVMLAMLPLVYRNRSGRNGWAAAATRAAWAYGVSKGQDVHQSGLLAPAGVSGRTLPGLLAPSVMYEGIDAFGEPFGLLHVPYAKSYSVVLGCDPEGSSLVDPDTADTWVALWGRWLAELSREPNLTAASATVETAPDPGSRLAQEVGRLLADDAPPLARAMLGDVVATYAVGSPAVTGRVALTFTATRRVVEDRELRLGHRRKHAAAGKPRSKLLTAEDMATQIGSRLPGLLAGLSGTGAGGGVRALTAAEIAQTVRVAYDPAVGHALDAALTDGANPGVTWASAGPTASVEGWDRLRHDSGTSVTWAMTEAPRGAVESGVLGPLLAPDADLTRKRVTLLYRPHRPSAAARIADADVKTARGRATSRTGEAKATETVELAAAQQTAREEAAGAGLTRFSLLVTATVVDRAELGHVADVVDQAGGASRITLRRVAGGQSAAFAACLGVGLVLTDHVTAPAAVRDHL